MISLKIQQEARRLVGIKEVVLQSMKIRDMVIYTGNDMKVLLLMNCCITKRPEI